MCYSEQVKFASGVSFITQPLLDINAVLLSDRMALTLSEVEELVTQSEDFQYVRFVWSDVNGIARGRTLVNNGNVVTGALRHGAGCYDRKYNAISFTVHFVTFRCFKKPGSFRNVTLCKL